MAKKKNKVSDRFIAKDHNKTANIANEAKRVSKGVKKVAQGMYKGTKQNLENLVATGDAVLNLDIADFVKSVVKGGKDYAASNKQVLKDIWALITGKNHPEWYTKYGTATTNLGFNAPKGSKVNSWNSDTYGLCIPYVSAIPMTDVESQDMQVVETAVNMLYAKLGGSNASTFPFTRRELFNYIFVVSSIHERMGFLRSQILAFNTFNSYDNNSPEPLLMTMGMNPACTNFADVLTSRARAIDAYNLLAARLSEILPMFPELSLFTRKAWLSQSLFRDDEDEYKAGLIKFVPYGACVAQPDGILTIALTEPMGARRMDNLFLARTLDEELEIINTMIDSVFINANGSQIAAYLLKAYGDRAYIPYAKVSADETISSVFDKQVLSQFKNAYYSSWDPNASHMEEDDRVFQTVTDRLNTNAQMLSNTLTAQDQNVFPVGRFSLNTQISSDSTEVTAGQTMSLTRLAAPLVAEIDSGKSNIAVITPTVVNTEIILQPRLIEYFGGTNIIDNVIPKIITSDTKIKEYAGFSQIAGIPDIFMVNVTDPGRNFQHAPYGWYLPIGDFEIVANYSHEQAVVLNHYVTMSLLATIDIEDQDNWRATTL